MSIDQYDSLALVGGVVTGYALYTIGDMRLAVVVVGLVVMFGAVIWPRGRST